MSRSVYADEGCISLDFQEWQDAVSGISGDPDPDWPYETGQSSGAPFRLEQLNRREARTLQAVEVLLGMTRADIAEAEIDTIPF